MATSDESVKSDVALTLGAVDGVKLNSEGGVEGAMLVADNAVETFGLSVDAVDA